MKQTMTKTKTMALIGNPDCGITTLFNQLTGGLTASGNYSATNSNFHIGPVKAHKSIQAVALPGTYSLSAYSADELATRDFLLNDRPDVIVNVVDASSFARSLYLTLQLMELGIPMVIAINMMDQAEKSNMSFDLQRLSNILTLPIIPISALKNQGIHDLVHYAIEGWETKTVPTRIDFCTGFMHTAIHSIAHLVEDYAKNASLPLRFACTRIVENDEPTIDVLNLNQAEVEIIDKIIKDLETHLGTDREAAMADMRYTYIEDIVRKTVKHEKTNTKEYTRSLSIDRVLTHKFFAIPIFICIMLGVFYFTFGSIGEYFSLLLGRGIDSLLNLLDGGLTTIGISPVVESLVIDGAGAGIGAVLSFLPRIAILFFFLSILEDSGYMARVAFVMDTLLRKLGLSGRSVVPMLLGFGCSVPAIMATRSLPSKRDRQLTMALIPFMSCSAKLPIYGLFVSVFFVGHEALAMGGIYLTGIIVATICAIIFKRTIFKGDPVPFILVLPPYRMPAWKNVWLNMWENMKGFIKKAFTIVFIATIVIWFLQSFDFGLNLVSNPNESILATIGKFVVPLFAPLGFVDWRASTALLTGLSAKEAVVSTMAVLSGSSDPMALNNMLSEVFTPLSAFAFLVFCLLYMPCVATLATIKKEMEGWKYALLVVFFQTCVAWLVAFFVYQVGSLIF